MYILVSRKPLITPGSYLKVFELSDNFCNVLSGRGKNQISTILNTFFLSNMANMSCPFEVN